MDKFVINDLSVRYSDGVESLRHVSFNIPANAITTLIGPGGSGKSTLLRCLNRLNDLADVDMITGQVLFNGMDVLAPDVDVIALRRKIGVVFSRPVPLPLSIYENITYSLVMGGERSKARLDDAVERSLHMAELWDEVHDRLQDPGTAISGGQQQRLCLARVLALQPEVILLDEPTSALDPISTAKIEGKLQELKSEYTIIIAPRNIQQAARLADHAVFLLQGELIEVGAGKDLFSRPRDSRTQDYVTGRFG